MSRTVIGQGVLVEDQNTMRLWNEYGFPQKPYQMALTGTAENAVVIGTGVARVLQLCEALKVKNCPQSIAKPTGPAAPEDITDLSALEEVSSAKSETGSPRIELLAANVHGAPNVAGLDVVEAELHGVKELDDISVLLHLAQAQKMVYGGDAPQATSIALQLKRTADIPVAQQRLEQLLANELKAENLEVHDFKTLNPSYGQITGMFGAIFGFISILIGAIVLFTVGNTMSMAVMERTVEIGTLRAMGVRRDGIRRLFVCEGLVLGLIGAVLGVVFALGLAY
nr:FtsX-like permease family protein [uncultured Deefgea sp.]